MSKARTRLEAVIAISAVLIALAVAIFGQRWLRPGPSAAASGKGEADEKSKEKGERRSVTLSKEALASAKLQTTKAERRPLLREDAFTGQVTFHADKVATIGSKVSARIVKVNVGVGDTVKAGDALASIDSMEFARARGVYLATVARRDAARLTLNREQELRKDGINATKDVEQAQAALLVATADFEAARGTLVAFGLGESGAAGPATIIRSPIAGKVVRRDAVMGQTVDAATSLFTVADLDEVWVLLDVFERDIGKVTVDAEVALTMTAYPERSFSGRVTQLGQVLDDRMRTMKARVTVPNTDGALKPGMFCRAKLVSKTVGSAVQGETGAGREALVVPIGAVQRIGDDDYVFVDTGDRTFEARGVALGERSGGSVEIRRGLREGELVVSDGALTLKAELERASFGDDD